MSESEKIKIITGLTLDELEKRVNEFLERTDIEVLNVTLSTSNGLTLGEYYVLIWYREKKS